jgi:hypothetical protein
MKSACIVLTALFAHTALAAPAPWYRWRSTSAPLPRIVCSQTPLGPHWERHDGPYKDARCERLTTPRRVGPRAVPDAGSDAAPKPPPGFL